MEYKCYYVGTFLVFFFKKRQKETKTINKLRVERNIQLREREKHIKRQKKF